MKITITTKKKKRNRRESECTVHNRVVGEKMKIKNPDTASLPPDLTVIKCLSSQMFPIFRLIACCYPKHPRPILVPVPSYCHCQLYSSSCLKITLLDDNSHNTPTLERYTCLSFFFLFVIFIMFKIIIIYYYYYHHHCNHYRPTLL